MIQSSDSEFENENDSQEEVIEVQENIIEALPEDKSLVVSEDVFPDSLSTDLAMKNAERRGSM